MTKAQAELHRRRQQPHRRRYRTWCGRSITRSISFSITSEEDAMTTNRKNSIAYSQEITATTTRRSSTVRTGRAAASSSAGRGRHRLVPGAALRQGAPMSPPPACTTKNTAKNVIFILLAGAPSHTDTFDLKVVTGVTPATLQPGDDQRHSVPHRAAAEARQPCIGDFAIVRSMQSHALVHSLAQTWTQIGRNPAAALGNIAPNIGSIVAIEKDAQRTPGQVFPTFLALNSAGGVGAGLSSGRLCAVQGHAHHRPASPTPPIPTARPASTTAGNLLHSLDDSLRVEFALWPADGRLQRVLRRRQGHDVQPGRQHSLRLHRRRQRALRQHRHGQCLPGGPPGAQGEPGHALHPDHVQRRLGHAPEHLRRQPSLPAKAKILDTAVAVADRRSESERPVRQTWS